MSQPLRIAIVGLGTVGGGVAQILNEQKQLISQRCGREVEIAAAVVRDPSKARNGGIPEEVLTTSFDCLTDPSIDIVLELIGGTTKAAEVVKTALMNGKSVVTANKALVCEQGTELFNLAREHGQTICFEAAVAGGIPIIEAVGQSLAANQIVSIEAILNGTSNFILSEMYSRGRSYEQALKTAQEKGYAEADPSMDVDGTDAAQKLTILSQLAFGKKVQLAEFLRSGIDHLTLSDLQYADRLGYRIKLLATVKRHGNQLEMHTQPTLIRNNLPMADVHDAYNMIEVVGDAVGRTWFSGMGAGQLPTASAVVSDLIDLAVGRAQLTFQHLDLWQATDQMEVLPTEQIERRCYYRFRALDRPGTFAAVAKVLGDSGISISSCTQYDQPEEVNESVATVPLVIMTHTATEGAFQKADHQLQQLDCLNGPHVRLPIRADVTE